MIIKMFTHICVYIYIYIYIIYIIYILYIYIKTEIHDTQSAQPAQ